MDSDLSLECSITVGFNLVLVFKNRCWSTRTVLHMIQLKIPQSFLFLVNPNPKMWAVMREVTINSNNKAACSSYPGIYLHQLLKTLYWYGLIINALNVIMVKTFLGENSENGLLQTPHMS